jgi:hypothetical protein
MRMLDRAAKGLSFLAIPKIGWVLIALQAFGYLLSVMQPEAAGLLPLIPGMVAEGEIWRVLTFLSVPVSQNPIWLFFGLWFMFFVTNTLEQEWGATKLTLYVLVSWALTVTFAMNTGYPVLNARHFETSLFLAVACLYPTFEVSLFLLFPIQMRILGYLSGALVLWEFLGGSNLDRLYLVCIYSGFLLFFGPVLKDRLSDALRRRRSKR